MCRLTTTVSPSSGGTWVSNNPSVASVTNAGVVTAGATGGSATFTFTSTATGCSNTTSAVTVDATCQVITLTQPQVLSATVNSTNLTCFGGNTGAINITSPAGGYGTYEYSINGGTNWQGSGSFTSLAANTYNVQIRDAAHTGCVIVLNAGLQITSPTEITFTHNDINVSCNGGNNGSITVTASGGTVGAGYTYSKDGTNYQAGNVFNGLTFNTYTVTVKDGNGCISAAQPVTIDEPAVLAATAVQNSAVTCNGAGDGSATVTVTGGNTSFSYDWDNGETTATATSLSGGLHVVDITDNKGCTTSATVNIDEPAVLAATAVQNSAVTCNGAGDGSATVTVTGGNTSFSYDWDNGETTATATGLSGGLHVVDITDNKGCTTSATVNINEPAVLAATAVQNSAVTCNGADNGSATVTVTGGNTAFSYAWDNGETTATATGLSGGLHVVDITDNKGCTTSATVNINEPAVLAATAVQNSAVTCNGADNGSATVTVTGGNTVILLRMGQWRNNCNGYRFKWRSACC